MCDEMCFWVHFNSSRTRVQQEHRTLKVIGGIVGITQNEKALDTFFLIAPELFNLLHEFAEYGRGDNIDKRTNTTKSQAESSPE